MDLDTKDTVEIIEHLRQQLAQTKQALHASETRFRNVIEKNGDGIIVVDQQGVVRFVNAAAELLLKRGADELLGQMLGFPLVAGNTTELDIVRHGESLVAEMRVVESEWEGQPVYLASLRDITKRKQVEESLRIKNYAIESALNPVAMADLSGNLTYVNPAFLTLWGYTHTGEVLGKSAIDFWQIGEQAATIIEALHQGRGWTGELTAQRKDRTMFDAQISASMVLNSDGRPLCMQAWFTDITERKQAEKTRATLDARNRQLQKAESLSLMAGAIAHHFNNQLQVVMGYLELALIDHPPHNAADRYLAQAMVAAERAAEISSLMLVYLGQTHDTFTPLELAETCTGTLATIQEILPPHVTLTVDFPTPGPVINANAIRIQQLLTNLVINACESIADQPGTIQLAVRSASLSDIPTTHRFPLDWHPQEQTYACLVVTDTGTGIAASDFDKLFDPFYSTKFTGRGLGLAVVLGVVRIHSGVVTVTSIPGHGSTFLIFFPAVPEEVPT